MQSQCPAKSVPALSAILSNAGNFEENYFKWIVNLVFSFESLLCGTKLSLIISKKAVSDFEFNSVIRRWTSIAQKIIFDIRIIWKRSSFLPWLWYVLKFDEHVVFRHFFSACLLYIKFLFIVFGALGRLMTSGEPKALSLKVDRENVEKYWYSFVQ